MIEEENLVGDALYNKILELKNRKDELIKNMENSDSKNGVESIVNILLSTIKK